MVAYRDVPGFPGYRVGDDGSVWSLWRSTGNKRQRTESWRELQGGIDKDGYRKVILCASGRRRTARVNILVLESFVGPAPEGMIAAHDNGIRTDNRLVNLRWDTQKGNVADKRRHGTHQAGEQHPMHKLTADQVREIRRRRADGETGVSLAREFGVWPGTISAIFHGRLWKELPPANEGGGVEDAAAFLAEDDTEDTPTEAAP